jgi:hypothetical protein
VLSSLSIWLTAVALTCHVDLSGASTIAQVEKSPHTTLGLQYGCGCQA